jgi:hypothetical protein
MSPFPIPTTYYLTDDQNPTGYAKPIEVRVGSTTGTPTTTYIIGDRVIGQDSSGTITYLLVDGLDNTRAVVSASGHVNSVINYDAFGNVLGTTYSLSNLPPTDFLFQQTMFDVQSGLNIFGDGTREEQVGMDNFIEADSPGYSNNDDPITLNSYLLDGANPINNIDPSGHAVYFMARQFNCATKYGLSSAGMFLNYAIGHGYILVTAPTDTGTGDPLTTGQRVIATFSWHPYKWNYSGSNVPGRVWEDASEDVNPALAGLVYTPFVVTTNPASQSTLLNYIHNWIATKHVGYELGPAIPDPINPGNDIGANAHIPPAFGRGWLVYYSAKVQNCVWWATAMLTINGIAPPKWFIAGYNGGVGGGPDIVNGVRGAAMFNTVNTLDFSSPALTAISF